MPDAIVTVIEGRTIVNMVGADLLAPLKLAAQNAATDAATSRDAANLAAATALAASRYFPTKVAGEAGSAIDQLFTTDDGAGNLIYYRRTSSGSTEIGRGITPATLADTSGADRVGYSVGVTGAVAQTLKDTVRRERLNLYDMIPKSLWPAIEAGTNTADLTTYVLAALGTGRGINARQGRFRMKAPVTGGSGLSIRGEGKLLTYFENVDNSPIITLDSSSAHILQFELEDVWLENRDPASFTTCDLLKITGAGDGNTYQNDKHHFRNLWFYRGRDNIVCDKRCIWPTWDRIESTGALRDAIHIESNGVINQWSFRDCVMKGAGRNAFFFKHDYEYLATGWTFWNGSFEDSGYEAIRITGSGGLDGFGLSSCTFENNARLLATGSSAVVEGVRRRKVQVHSDAAHLIGFDINRTNFFNNGSGGSGGDPDNHIYLSAFDAANAAVLAQSGEIRNSRFLATQSGIDVIWPIGLTYGASNINAGPVQLDETRGSIDLRKFVAGDHFNGVQLTLTGVSGTPMGLARFVKQGDLVTAFFPRIVGTSNGPTTIIAGLPAALRPASDQPIPVIVQDPDVGVTMGLMTVQNGGNIVLGKNPGGDAFPSTGTKGVAAQTATWVLS